MGMTKIQQGQEKNRKSETGSVDDLHITVENEPETLLPKLRFYTI